MSGARLSDVTELTLESAAELFGVLSTPVRLQIIRVLCDGEQSVTHLLAQIEASQSNMSRHLHVLHQSGVLTRRRDGHQIFYRLADASRGLLCRLVCSQHEPDGSVFAVPV